MKEIIQLRKTYGSVYLTILPDGRKIPWKPLSIKEFLEYESLRELNAYPIGCLEDEIFLKCVLDTTYTNNIDRLRAGLISTIVTNIMSVSGPTQLNELEAAMEGGRAMAQGIFNQFVKYICMAFPGYKPEDIYAMDYSTLMQRLALAEDKLLQSGMLNEKLTFTKPEDKIPKTRPRPKLDSKKLYDIYEQSKQPQQTIISNKDMQEHSQIAYSGHEKIDKVLLEDKMVKETIQVYPEYLKQIKENNGKFAIPSEEERIRIAKARVIENERKYKEKMKQQAQLQKQQDKKELKQLLAIKEKARAKKAKKRY